MKMNTKGNKFNSKVPHNWEYDAFDIEILHLLVIKCFEQSAQSANKSLPAVFFKAEGNLI